MDIQDAESTRQKVGMVVFALGVILPGMVVGGFMPDWDVLPLVGWLAISAGGGLLGGFLWHEQRPMLGGAAGLVSGASSLIALVIYIEVRSSLSDTFFHIEFLIPLAVGVIPGCIVVRLMADDEEQPEDEARPDDAP